MRVDEDLMRSEKEFDGMMVMWVGVVEKIDGGEKRSLAGNTDLRILLTEVLMLTYRSHHLSPQPPTDNGKQRQPTTDRGCRSRRSTPYRLLTAALWSAVKHANNGVACRTNFIFTS
jgi:hypothetical protein